MARTGAGTGSPVPCPLCGSASSRPVHRESWISIRRCRACGFRFTEERSGDFRDDAIAAEIDEFYRWLDRYRDARVPLLARRLESIRARFGLPQGPLSVFEVGTGGGALAHACLRLGHRYTGLEPFLGARFEGADDPAVTIVPERIESYAPAERFDLAVLDNVLEHLADPVGAARKVLGLLAPGGVAWFQVPNEVSPVWKHRLLARIKERRITFPGHVNLFTRKTLARCLEAAGASAVTLDATSASDPVLTRLLLMDEPGVALRAVMAGLRATRLDVLAGWAYWLDAYARP